MTDKKKTTDPLTATATETTLAKSAAGHSLLDPNTKLTDLNIADLHSIIATETGKAIASQLANAAASRAGSHVNSGPPGFVNGGGHANFDPAANLGSRVNVANLGAAGVHVNSGPPGFVNGGGHANFDPTSAFGSRVNVSNLGKVASHVNSGPPGFVNGGGHANFDPKSNFGAAFVNVTLPDGGQVAIPATGPVDIQVRGFRVTR
jgi:hypothetical protein